MINFNIFTNKTKKTIKTYLIFSEIVKGVKSLDEMRDRLRKISDTIVYKDEYNHFYLTKEEATSQKIIVSPITIKEILDDSVLRIFFIMRLNHFTLYQEEDLVNIPSHSKLIWCDIIDEYTHFVLYKDSIIYPTNYSIKSLYRFGYKIITNNEGLKGVYDIDNDKIVIDCEYQYMKNLGNLVEVLDDKYKIIDVDNNELLLSSDKPILDELPKTIRDRIDLSKVLLKDYLNLFNRLQDKEDLINIGLWNAQVVVYDIPKQFREIIKNKDGVIGYEYPLSGDIFDMKKVLPITFKKVDGDFITIGVEHKYVFLKDRKILKNMKLPACYSKIPNWLKLKNEDYEFVEIDCNKIDDMLSFDKEEFKEFIDMVDDEKLIIYLTLFNTTQREEFFELLDDLEYKSLSIGIKERLENIEDISIDLQKMVTLEMDMEIEYIKYKFYQKNEFDKYLLPFIYKSDEELVAFQKKLFISIYSQPFIYLPNYFNQLLTKFKYIYKDEYEEVANHLAKYFGNLILSFYTIQKYNDKDFNGLKWFIEKFSKHISIDNKDTKNVLYNMNNIFKGIILKNKELYIVSMIHIMPYLSKWYPLYSENFLFIIEELLKSVALNKISINSANSLLELFEKLPILYKHLNFKMVMELKNKINYCIKNYKPLDNEVFLEDGVKAKRILLNYLVDNEYKEL